MTPSSGDAFQTKSQIAALLNTLGRRPVHRFGQNFLIDRNLMEKLVESAMLDPRDCVLEVGPGTGSLTGLLLQRAARVVAVEIDTYLADHLERTFGGDSRFTLVRGDCLSSKLTLAPHMLDAIREARDTSAGGALKLVANLPYDAATPLVIELLLSELGFSRLCFTVQSEVADRFLADASRAWDFGPVSIIVQALCRSWRIASCPPQAFWPQPDVNSTILRLDVHAQPPAGLSPPAAFAAFVRSMFLHRRKTIVNNARTLNNSDKVIAAIKQMGINERARPENLSVDEWISLWSYVTP